MGLKKRQIVIDKHGTASMLGFCAKDIVLLKNTNKSSFEWAQA